MRKTYAIPGLLSLMCVLVFSCQAFGQAPRFKSSEEKAAWIAQHPEAQSSATQPATAKQQSDSPAPSSPNPKATSTKPVIVRPTSGLPAGHPIYIDTGNPEADEAAYARAKDAYYDAEEKAAAEKEKNTIVESPEAKERRELAEKQRLRAEAIAEEQARKAAIENSKKNDQ
jgi:hypothetical protein